MVCECYGQEVCIELLQNPLFPPSPPPPQQGKYISYILAWKANTAVRPPSSQAILEEGFNKAKEIVADEVGLVDEERCRVLLEGKTSMLDVYEEIVQAQRVYGSNLQCKARKWLVALSERITYYGQIFDVLVQHHPEYVSLAWGAFKFVFVVSLKGGTVRRTWEADNLLPRRC